MSKITAQDLKDHVVKVEVNDPYQEHFDKLMEAIGNYNNNFVNDNKLEISHYIINRYIKNIAPQNVKTLTDSLKDFKRFPLWMWRNEEMLNFIDWCRRYNDRLEAGFYDKVSFYGLDLYSLHTSSEAVIDYLQKVDPKAARKARERYGVFERFGKNTMSYAFAARYGLVKSAEEEVVAVLTDLCRKRGEYLLKQLKDFGPIEEYQFAAEENSLVVKDAEEYYRRMLCEDVKSWNLRDTHMVRALNQILDHLTKCQNGCPAKAGPMIYLTAAHEWNTSPKIMKIVPGRKDSYEGVFHKISVDLKLPNFLIIFNKIVSSSSNPEELNSF
ncbi:10488_t:CDS:2 [Dentiscutata erythropus]|uniref:10488_t:CDS:1 n=1 Tax=Dentiscutata erythropus TaxID=1348616 RepID=A0A9N8WE86_9GLOM|nr:10488_t:CDS:2 [Dentiscutata erythropus]